jgi:hypothetical protein
MAGQLRSFDQAIPVPWKSDVSAPSKSILDNLIDTCKSCDFAVLFFTKDIERVSPGKNSIFEAGLFIGGLGLNPQRCIIVSSVSRDSLPSDMEGVTYISIDEPPPAEALNVKLSDEWCREHLQGALESVLYSVNHYGELLQRPLLTTLTRRQLIIREQVGKACLQKHGRVVFISPEPQDLNDFEFNQIIAHNIKSHIYYDFHFNWELENNLTLCSQWIESLRMILTLYCDEDNVLTERDFRDDKAIKDFLTPEWIKSDANNLIKNALSTLGEHLHIYLHKNRFPIPFRMVLHNANSADKAKCYLRHDDIFVEWFIKGEARDSIDIIKTSDESQNIISENRIFQNTDTLTIFLDGKDSMQKLKSDLKEILGFTSQHELKNDKYKDQTVDKVLQVFKESSNLQKYTYSNDIKIKIREAINDQFPSVMCREISEWCLGE